MHKFLLYVYLLALRIGLLLFIIRQGMDSLTREDVFFTNLLEKGSNMSIDFILESTQLESLEGEVCIEQFPSETELGSIAKKPTRGVKFTVEEDLLIVSAWLNTSMDPIVTWCLIPI
jgi:hypothetical protein